MDTITCFLCDNSFTDKTLLLEHLKEYEKLFPCNQCGQFLVSLGDLEKHLKSHPEEKLFPCNVCEKCFTTLCDLKRHKVIHSGDKPFACKECGKKVKRKKTLKWHVKMLHNEQRPMKCKECNKSFSGANILKNHNKIHIAERRGSGREKIKCTVCENWFAKSYFTNHKRTHLEEKPFQCKLCEKRFTQKNKFDRSPFNSHW